jgi:hypothetical protein
MKRWRASCYTYGDGSIDFEGSRLTVSGTKKRRDWRAMETWRQRTRAAS